MKSTILKYLQDGQEYLTIGNEQYIKKIKETAQQIICELQIEHTLQDWYMFETLTEQDLFTLLNTNLEHNLYTNYPN